MNAAFRNRNWFTQMNKIITDRNSVAHGLDSVVNPIDAALLSRRAVRGYLSRPVTRETVEHLLKVAARMPSGYNMQPWQVFVVSGPAKQRLTADVMEARVHHPEEKSEEYQYYPKSWRSPYSERRKDFGDQIYGLAGVKREDEAAMFRHVGRNYEFFGAPVGLFFAIDKDLEVGSWLDCGMFIAGVMIAARAQGLHTCPQVAWAPWHRIVRRHVAIPESMTLLCGMSLGFEDETTDVNQARMDRSDIKNWATFIDL